jgi:SAM-dependent methyltransferase
VHAALEAIDEQLFARIRADICARRCRGAAFAALVESYVDRAALADLPADEPGYDLLDLFVDKLLRIPATPEETLTREPEMVRYHPTPTHIIFDMVETAQFTADDHFCDIGSGLGRVPILVNLLSGAAAHGVEIEPSFCEYARACAATLGLSQVSFANADARHADYSTGTIFFLYTPFVGRMFEEVLKRLHDATKGRSIRIFTYGPCTHTVARQSWLVRIDPHGERRDRLGRFVSA